MSAISATLKLVDQMTAPVMSINHAINSLIAGFDGVEQASGINADSLEAMRRQVNAADFAAEQLNQQFKLVEEAIQQSEDAQKGFNNSIQQGRGAADGLCSKLMGAAAALGGAAAIKSSVKLSDTAANTTARLSLLADDGGSVEALQQKVLALAGRSRSAYLDTADVAAKMGLNAGSAFAGNDELLAFVEQVNKLFVIGGASAQEQANATLQLTQAMAAGALRGEELNSILEGAPGIARAIEQYMGIAEGSIKKYASEGAITAEIVKNALFFVADETNAKFEAMPQTWEHVWNNMQSIGLFALEPLLKKINELANSEKTGEMVNSLISGLSAVASVAGGTLDLVAGAGTAIYDNWEWLAPIVTGVAIAYLGLHGAVLAYNAAQAISNGLKAAASFQEGVHAAAKAMSTGATFAQTAAQHGLNAALLACPLTWILLIIVAVIAVIYAVIGAMNKFRDTSVSATGVIAGAFTALGAGIINTFIIPTQNQFASFVNFLGNGIKDPVSAIIILFADMCITVMGYIRNLAHGIEELINAIPGVEVSITSGLDSFYDGLQQAQKAVKDKSGWVEYMEKWDYLDLGDAFNSGYEFGEGVDDAVSGMFDFSSLEDIMNAQDDGSARGILENTANMAGDTAAMRDSLEISDEDIKYMRDIAEREAINRFTTAQVTIHQTNNNQLSSDMDLDGIMDRWADEFTEKMIVSSEGVHS